ncbi:MAG TPA: flagellar biosynthesis protein FlgJ [Candidatus Desulfofervidus auxilii]|uniref:Flagellar biosynthesis protein FlgJ n=1 Tax=Desulfofervidus auxilii TaxID=1621989 RepID=A0A7V0NE98_DESA2|nr:flagellar biosynthesis protein FlgJ [Candidatus Desulfofervidus auxilii]
MTQIYLSATDDKKQVESQALKRACKEFESFFIYYLLKVMRKTVPKVELFYGGLAQDIYTSMLDEELAKKAANIGGLGLANLLYQQLSRKSPNVFKK